MLCIPEETSYVEACVAGVVEVGNMEKVREQEREGVCEALVGICRREWPKYKWLPISLHPYWQ